MLLLSLHGNQKRQKKNLQYSNAVEMLSYNKYMIKTKLLATTTNHDRI